MFLSLKNRILDTLDLKQLISEHVPLKRFGKVHRGLCPFHAEKTPSFHVYSDHYHCFGCSAHGDGISFVRKIHGLSYIAALKKLAAYCGVDASELSQSTSSQRAHNKRNELIRSALQQAQSFYSCTLHDHSKRAETARQYLHERKFTDAFIHQQGFGLAPQESRVLFNTLRDMGFSIDVLRQSSLISSPAHSKQHYDFFQSRITFPIVDHRGTLIAFSGRVFGEKCFDDKAKYKNSRYAKNKVLYGLHHAQAAIRSQGQVLVTEGYMDTLQLWNHSLNHAVACQGTALTLPHLQALHRLTQKVILIFDGDAAGDQAALRTLAFLSHFPQLRLFRVELPPGSDPDSYLREQGKEAFERSIACAVLLLEGIITKRLATTPMESVPGMIEEEFFPWIQSVHHHLTKESLLLQISHLTGLSHETLRRQYFQFTGSRNASRSTPTATTDKDKDKTETVDAETSQPPALSPALWELLCHLFYASAEDGLDLKELTSFVSAEIEITEFWHHLFSSFFDILHEHHTSPATVALKPQEQQPPLWPPLWEDNHYQQIITTLIASAPRYRTSHRQAAIAQITAHIKQQKLSEHINRLKSQLLQTLQQGLASSASLSESASPSSPSSAASPSSPSPASAKLTEQEQALSSKDLFSKIQSLQKHYQELHPKQPLPSPSSSAPRP